MVGGTVGRGGSHPRHQNKPATKKPTIEHLGGTQLNFKIEQTKKFLVC